MYAYCGNNPVVRTDTAGNLWHIALGAALGGVLAGVSKAIESIASGDNVQEVITKTVVSTVFGAIGGAVAATGLGVVGQGIVGGALGAGEYVTTQALLGEEIDAVELMTNTASGLAGGFMGGDGASYGSKFMKYHHSEFVNNISTCGLEVAYDKLKRHTWNWAKSNLKDATTEGVLKAFGGSKLSSLCMSADPYTLYELGY